MAGVRMGERRQGTWEKTLPTEIRFAFSLLAILFCTLSIQLRSATLLREESLKMP